MRTIARFRRLMLVTAGGSLMATAACTSIKTTLFDADNYAGNGEREKRCLRGIPITMDVPTHIQITVTETSYFTKDTTGRYVPACVPPTHSMKYDLIVKKELYTVDFKRPAAGINDLKISFDGGASNGQYFSSISQDVTDVTIDKVAALIKQILDSTPTLASLAKSANANAGNTDPAPAALIAVPRVVACEFFDLRFPNLERRIQCFLEQQINHSGGAPVLHAFPEVGGAAPAGPAGPLAPVVPVAPGAAQQGPLGVPPPVARMSGLVNK